MITSLLLHIYEEILYLRSLPPDGQLAVNIHRLQHQTPANPVPPTTNVTAPAGAPVTHALEDTAAAEILPENLFWNAV